ncbi:nucleoside recognition domain-containing protein [Enterococcus hulanensis]|uniref:Nucleoside recognition domain-containing protein n=1 Tax=Enterococcus hulanensis TaxID=2559929 RepID=A0ABU3F241_9ENTE|nr:MULTISPECIES: nucleoside recognition domain-containing protein [Enterococcus]MBX8937428.1 hypothetical protein [Enterococcus gilvus]MDT2601190.1 nucleoside recognition domain-containing protein [Enterococcus hulanensis]MDT2610900.1 nucleoside recognition domain-containing protein [Enterococcus hulanensis]MDT2618305.1 nucleoside recognition domain-containing protein [Enterococcus hulanensis]MDT2629125.1 nucleoside recognition domain-containing protein [Enterococcus hulanensis]
MEKKVTWKSWLSLFFLIVMLSGLFKDVQGPLKALDFLNLTGNFGTIFEEVNFQGQGGVGAREGVLVALTILPSVVFAVGLIETLQSFGAFNAAEKLFTPILRPILGIPGSAGIAFISSFTSSDVGSVMTKELFDNGQLSDDERSVFTSYQYTASAVILNTINTQAVLLPIVVWPIGLIIVFLIVMKILGANLVRIILKISNQKELRKWKKSKA